MIAPPLILISQPLFNFYNLFLRKLQLKFFIHGLGHFVLAFSLSVLHDHAGTGLQSLWSSARQALALSISKVTT